MANKTKDSQIKASVEYDKRNGLVVIGCKITSQQKKVIEDYVKSIGMSRNTYLKNLIKSDLDAKGVPYPDDSNIQE